MFLYVWHSKNTHQHWCSRSTKWRGICGICHRRVTRVKFLFFFFFKMNDTLIPKRVFCLFMCVCVTSPKQNKKNKNKKEPQGSSITKRLAHDGLSYLTPLCTKYQHRSFGHEKKNIYIIIKKKKKRKKKKEFKKRFTHRNLAWFIFCACACVRVCVCGSLKWQFGVQNSKKCKRKSWIHK